MIKPYSISVPRGPRSHRTSAAAIVHAGTALAHMEGGQALRMAATRRDDLLEQIRALPLEDRENIESALVRDAYAQGRMDSPEELGEITRRATEALESREGGHTREDSVTRVHAAIEAIRSRDP
jgi:hypothetical protein